jgi:hypothetical protein
MLGSWVGHHEGVLLQKGGDVAHTEIRTTELRCEGLVDPLNHEEGGGECDMNKTQVEKDLGEIIVANNPSPGLMQPPSSGVTFKPPGGFPSWPALPDELRNALGLSPSSPYLVNAAHVVNYVNQGDPSNKIHQLWIIYGSGGP